MSKAIQKATADITRQRLAEIKSLIPGANRKLASLKKTYGKNSDIYKTASRYVTKVFEMREVTTEAGYVSAFKIGKTYSKGLPTQDYTVMKRTLEQVPTVSDVREGALRYAGLTEKEIKAVLRKPKKKVNGKTADDFVKELRSFENTWANVKDQFYEVENIMGLTPLGEPRKSKNGMVEYLEEDIENSPELTEISNKVEEMQRRLVELKSNTSSSSQDGWRKIQEVSEQMRELTAQFESLRNTTRGNK